MASILERIPHDVLTHIAILCASSSSIFEPPVAIAQLSATSRTISASLSRQFCPQLYANIFRTKFDLAAGRRRMLPERLTSSSLSAELVQRCRVLQRIRRGDMSSVDILQDLFTVYMMILENDSLNEKQLLAAGFPRYIAEFIRNQYVAGSDGFPQSNQVRTLAFWSFWLTLSRQMIVGQTLNERSELLLMLRPFAICGNRTSGYFSTMPPPFEHEVLDQNGTVVIYYSQPMTLPQPNLSSASILLTFVLNEVLSLSIPPHLPLTRAIAEASHHSGPTVEDYTTAARYRTLLPADLCYESGKDFTDTRSFLHDQDFCRMFRDPSTFLLSSEVSPFVPGMLNGLWEGYYMVSPFVTPSLSPRSWPDFLLRYPLQCCLREKTCDGSDSPLPVGCRDIAGAAGREFVDDTPPTGFNLGSSRQSQPFLPTSPSASSRGGNAVRCGDPQEAQGISVTGETLLEHDQAWGAYSFSGRVRLRDGLVTLTRKSKGHGNDSMGIWIFEGYIHAGSGFVGRWYPSGSTEQNGIEGIFSMRKSHDPRQERLE